jgi:hypothetical protein
MSSGVPATKSDAPVIAEDSAVLERVDLTEDGGLVKEILKYGSGDLSPQKGDEVEG